MYRIAIDCRDLGLKRASDTVTTGIQHFAMEIIDELVRIHENEMELFFVIDDSQTEFYRSRYENLVVLNRFFLPVFNKMEKLKARGCGRFRHFPHIRAMHKRKLRQYQFDVVWLPFFTANAEILGENEVVTVHDLIPVYESEKCRSLWKKRLAEVHHVVCISNYTKQEVKPFIPNIERIDVIPNSIVLDVEKKKPVDIGSEYILNINAFARRKNQETLLRAFAKIDSTIHLVLVGGYEMDGYLGELRELASRLRVDHRVHFFLRIGDAERNWLLTNARIFVNPSTSEGFGRTPVEAAICEIPVLTTRVTSLEEVTKGLVHYIDDPYDVDELTGKISQMLNEKTDEFNLKKIGNRLKKSYTPEMCAEKYLAVFKEIKDEKRI